MRNAVDLSSDVSVDLENFYESGKYTETDISINVGKEPNNKIFVAHSIMLCSRCKYLENKIMACGKVQHKVLVFEDIEPDVFEVLLR